MKTILAFITIGLLSAGTVLAEEAMDLNLPSMDSLQAVDLGQLDVLRGRENITTITETSTTVSSSQSMESSINNSSFSSGGIESGMINIGEQAMDHFSGIGVFNMLTGNNNAVNATVGVNIYIDGNLTQQ